MKKRAVLLLIVVMLAAGCGKSGTKSEIKKQEEKPVQTALLEKKEIIQVIEGNEKTWERVITEICNYRQLSNPKVVTKGK